MGWVKQNYSLPVPAAATTGWLCPHVDFLKPFPLCLFVLIFLFVPLQIKKRLPRLQQSFQISYDTIKE